MKKWFYTLGLFFTCYGFALAQEAGIRMYAGLTQAKNRVAAVTPASTQHTGHHAGADARLNSGDMFFNVGVRYTKIDLVANSNLNFFEVNDIHEMFHIRGGLGFYLWHINRSMAIRSKLMASMDLNSSYEKEAIEGNAPYDKLNEGGMGAVTGLSFDWNSLTLDLEYEYGFIHTYSKQKESKVDSWSLSLGFFF